MVKNLGREVTQSEFGKVVGIAQQTVSELLARGVLTAGGSVDDWVLDYCTHLREVAAARAAAGDLDLATERARLAKEQADRLRMANQERRRELAPAAMLEGILTRTGARVAMIFATLPDAIARRVPQLDPDSIEAARREVEKVRAIALGLSLASLEDPTEATDDGEDDDGEPLPPLASDLIDDDI